MVVLVVLEFHVRRVSSYITLPIYAIEPYHLWFLPAYLWEHFYMSYLGKITFFRWCTHIYVRLACICMSSYKITGWQIYTSLGNTIAGFSRYIFFLARNFSWILRKIHPWLHHVICFCDSTSPSVILVWLFEILMWYSPSLAIAYSFEQTYQITIVRL